LGNRYNNGSGLKSWAAIVGIMRSCRHPYSAVFDRTIATSKRVHSGVANGMVTRTTDAMPLRDNGLAKTVSDLAYPITRGLRNQYNNSHIEVARTQFYYGHLACHHQAIHSDGCG